MFREILREFQALYRQAKEERERGKSADYQAGKIAGLQWAIEKLYKLHEEGEI